MKAITVRQPWAWAIATGLKSVENRTWRARYRGPLVIHAGKARCPAGLVLPDGTAVQDAALVYRAAVAVADLVDCVPIEAAPPGPFTSGPWCWLLANVRVIEPVYLPGKQLLWDVPDELIIGRMLAPHPAAPGRRTESRPSAG